MELSYTVRSEYIGFNPSKFTSSLNHEYISNQNVYFFILGLSHVAIARLLAERYAHKERKMLTLLVKEQKLTPAEMRRSCMLPQ